MLLLIALLTAAVLTILTPILTMGGHHWVLAGRVVIGIAQVSFSDFFLKLIITYYLKLVKSFVSSF